MKAEELKNRIYILNSEVEFYLQEMKKWSERLEFLKQFETTDALLKEMEECNRSVMSNSYYMEQMGRQLSRCRAILYMMD